MKPFLFTACALSTLASLWMAFASPHRCALAAPSVQILSKQLPKTDRPRLLWSLERDGQLFEQPLSQPIWNGQIEQIFADERALHPNFYLQLGADPSCPLQPLIALIKLCCEQKVDLVISLHSPDGRHAQSS